MTKLEHGSTAQYICSIQLNSPGLLGIVALFTGTMDKEADVTESVCKVGTNKGSCGANNIGRYILNKII
jgi:hypothetical protein